mgnify:CR=1 FL=1|jgi:hypothetical protein
MPKKIKDENIINLDEIFTLLWKGKFIIIFSILISISIFSLLEINSKSLGVNTLYFNGNFKVYYQKFQNNGSLPKPDPDFDPDKDDVMKYLTYELNKENLFEKFVHNLNTQSNDLYPKNLSQGFRSFIISSYTTNTGIINLKFTWKDFDEGEKIFNEIIINNINKVKNELFETINKNFQLNRLTLKESLKIISLRKKLAKASAIQEKNILLKILNNRKNFAIIIQDSEYYKSLSEKEKLNLINQDYQVNFQKENIQVNFPQNNLGNLAQLDVYLGMNPEIIGENIKFIDSKSNEEFLLLSINYQNLIDKERSIINNLAISESIYKTSIKLLESMDFKEMFLYNKNFENETPGRLNKLILFILLGIFFGISISYFREKK